MRPPTLFEGVGRCQNGADGRVAMMRIRLGEVEQPAKGRMDRNRLERQDDAMRSATATTCSSRQGSKCFGGVPELDTA